MSALQAGSYLFYMSVWLHRCHRPAYQSHNSLGNASDIALIFFELILNLRGVLPISIAKGF